MHNLASSIQEVLGDFLVGAPEGGARFDQGRIDDFDQALERFRREESVRVLAMELLKLSQFLRAQGDEAGASLAFERAEGCLPLLKRAGSGAGVEEAIRDFSGVLGTVRVPGADVNQGELEGFSPLELRGKSSKNKP